LPRWRWKNEDDVREEKLCFGIFFSPDLIWDGTGLSSGSNIPSTGDVDRGLLFMCAAKWNHKYLFLKIIAILRGHHACVVLRICIVSSCGCHRKCFASATTLCPLCTYRKKKLSRSGLSWVRHSRISAMPLASLRIRGRAVECFPHDF